MPGAAACGPRTAAHAGGTLSSSPQPLTQRPLLAFRVERPPISPPSSARRGWGCQQACRGPVSPARDRDSVGRARCLRTSSKPGDQAQNPAQPGAGPGRQLGDGGAAGFGDAAQPPPPQDSAATSVTCSAPSQLAAGPHLQPAECALLLSPLSGTGAGEVSSGKKCFSLCPSHSSLATPPVTRGRSSQMHLLLRGHKPQLPLTHAKDPSGVTNSLEHRARVC